MIHTKSLIRRLAYVPWLLAFGLVLGWAGEAQAAITSKVGQVVHTRGGWRCSRSRLHTGTTGVGNNLVSDPVSFDLIDNDQQSTTITLSYGEAKIAQDADPTEVTVTATLDGKVLDKSLTIHLAL